MLIASFFILREKKGVMIIVTKTITTIHLDTIKENARIYFQKILENDKETKWLALLPIDYYGEEAFLYKKEKEGYSVTGTAFIVNKTGLKQKQEQVKRDFRYAYVQAIYV